MSHPKLRLAIALQVLLAPALLAVSGCAAATVPLASATPPAHAEAQPLVALLRMAIVTRDIERAKRFYTEALGYEVRFDGDISEPDNRVLLSLAPEETARFVAMRGKSEIGGKPIPSAGVGLLFIARAGGLPRVDLPVGNGLATGETMMALATDDLDAVIERLAAFGAPIVAGPIVSEDGREREIVTRDPDGTRIHVVQMLSGR